MQEPKIPLSLTFNLYETVWSYYIKQRNILRTAKPASALRKIDEESVVLNRAEIAPRY